MIKIKGYCLTLENSLRHIKMKNKLDKIKNLSYEFIFGKSFNKDFVYSFVNTKSDVWKLSQFSKEETYIQRAYSCAEGHRRIMETFLNQDEYNWALVMEDDLILGENIIEQLNYVIENYNSDWYHLSTEAFFNYLNNVQPLTFQEKPQLLYCKRGNSTVCYLINKNFA